MVAGMAQTRLICFGLIAAIAACKSGGKKAAKAEAPDAAAKPVAAIDAGAPVAKTPEPKEDAKGSSDEDKAYRAALKEGRKLHKAKKYAQAVKAFETALAVYPDDPRAL